MEGSKALPGKVSGFLSHLKIIYYEPQNREHRTAEPQNKKPQPAMSYIRPELMSKAAESNIDVNNVVLLL
jgi:hypothetical protein